jgi:hypothetical protein
MRVSKSVRLVSLVAAAVVTLGIIGEIAGYAYPMPKTMTVAIATR